MRKILVLVLALVAIFAVGSVTAFAGKTKKVETSVTIKFKAGDAYYEQGDEFSGKVSAKKKCKQQRKVIIKAESGSNVGKTLTANNGKYSLTVDNVDPGEYYYAKVKKRTYKKGKKKIVCKSAKSDFVQAS
jgi:pyruvate kinase